MKIPSCGPALASIWAFAFLLLGCGGGADAVPDESAAQRPLRLDSLSLSSPVVDTFKVLASDGAGIDYVTNQWGGHQGRITRHRDGTVRVLYIRPNPDGFNTMEWRVLARSPASTAWSLEQSGVTSDDVNLLRDPNSDQAYVLAYPNSTPTVYLLPSRSGTAIPGSWAHVGPDTRHYSAAGIGQDGTLCFKTSVELPALKETSNTETHLVCGSVSTSKGWRWSPEKIRNIGDRHTYDYLFPGGFGSSGQLVATAQSDVKKTATGYLNVNRLQTYIFNGIGIYTANTSGYGDLVLRDLLPAYGTPSPAQASVAPLARMIDSFNDSKHRVISTYYAEPGSGASTPARGFYTVIANPDGSAVPGIHWTGLPQYGSVRIFEDGSKRLWLLWTGQGVAQTQMKLFALQQDVTGQALVLGRVTDFGKPFGEYSIDGAPHLALTSKGQVADNYVEGMFAACEETYSPDRPFSSLYYPSGNGSQKIVYFRIRLPN